MLRCCHRTLSRSLHQRVLGMLLMLWLILALAVAGCEEKKSSGGGGGNASGPPPEQVAGPGKVKKVASKDEKAAKVLRQLNNYLLGITAQGGAPADLAAAKEALKLYNQVSWMNDPWGAPYVYKKTGDNTFEVYSSGPDGQEGTADDMRVEEQ
ncbi:MAG: hypothetical protein CO108_24585 [Deltaproteobacteria bacterium CG_4_9_14_3_um_filter_63_12]|nr:MAG: hypothetical protein CO108_24585 [Deltaproteobacteria bacterium CG_4_9_14_3_um_filter_63_12]